MFEYINCYFLERKNPFDILKRVYNYFGLLHKNIITLLEHGLNDDDDVIDL